MITRSFDQRCRRNRYARHGLLLATALGAAIALKPAVVRAQTVVKLASLVPDGSVWHRILVDQAASVRRATGGRVEVRIYPGGVAGDDPDIVRKLRIGQLQAGAITVQGLVTIDEAFRAFQIPLFYASPEEFFFVLDHMTPVLRERLEEKGFVLLGWGYAGWAHLYSRKPVRSVADVRAQKVFMWGGEERSLKIWRELGLQPVGLASTDIMMALQTGMIDALVTTPTAIVALQWFRMTPYQLEPGLSPLVGATVMTRRAWNNLAEQDRSALLESARVAERRFRSEVQRQEAQAVTVMVQRGLTRTTLNAAARPEWEKLLQSMATAMRGELVPGEIFDLAQQARSEYRRRSEKAAQN